MRKPNSISIATNETTTHRRANAPEITVWDPLVRVGHWLLVVFFFIAYVTEDDLLTLHSWAGYGVGIYIVVRIIWGFVGPKHARFSDFAYGPIGASTYLVKLLSFQAKRYLGHSPAGGLMVFALLASLALTTISGVALLAVEENAGPLAPWLGRTAAAGETRQGRGLITATAHASEYEKGEERDEKREEGNGKEKGGEALEDVHEVLSDLTLFLVLLHISGVLWTSLVHRENLVRAMITGRKRAE